MSKLRVEAGRRIVRESDNTPLYTLHRVCTETFHYTTSPVEADEFVRHIVRACNAHKDLVEALNEFMAVGAELQGSKAIRLATNQARAALRLARKEG